MKWVIADPGSDDAARMSALFQQAKEIGAGFGIPAPVFAEFLVRTDDATTEVLLAIERKRGLRVLPFDKRAAHECALLDRAALATGDKKAPGGSPWQKVKIDRQILAISRVNGAQLLVTADRSLTTMAHRLGLTVKAVADLPIPDAARQMTLLAQLADPNDGADAVPPPTV